MESRISADTEIMGDPLPLPSLRVLASPLRLVSAAMWQVVKRQEVKHYGKLEEFVTSLSEAVPRLLSYRHKAKLILGLQAMVVLDLFRHQDSPPDPSTVQHHLDRIRVPSYPVDHKSKKDAKVEVSVTNFHQQVQILLEDPGARENFFREVFPLEYGAQFSSALEKLMWEFLVRLDQLLPVPDLAQTISWLSSPPVVLEECAQSITQPQLLKALLQHQKCLGHVDGAEALCSSSSDSILSSLSLPPSGHVPTPAQETNPTRESDETPKTTNPTPSASPSRDDLCNQPVICLVRHKELPAPTGEANGKSSDKGARDRRSARVSARKKAGLGSRLRRDKGKRKWEEEGGMQSGDSDSCPDNGRREELQASQNEKVEMTVMQLKESCLSRQPRVLIRQLDPAVLPISHCQSLDSLTPNKVPGQKREPPEPEGTPERELQDKENRAELCSAYPAISPRKPGQPTRGTVASSEGSDEVIMDSEDEESKGFRGRLFLKRYYRTKHNTYVPTLREFWRPSLARPALSHGHR